MNLKKIHIRYLVVLLNRELPVYQILILKTVEATSISEQIILFL